MNKKYMMLGFLGLFAVALVSAGVVNYLSNTAEVELSVDYAAEVAFANIDDDSFPLNTNGDWTSSLVIEDTTQLSTILAGVQIKNNADVAIEDKILKLVVSNNNSDVTCADITSLMFLDTATQTQLDKGFQQLAGVGLCTDDGIEAVYNIDINSLAAETVYEYPAKITFGAVNPADYAFTAQMVIA